MILARATDKSDFRKDTLESNARDIFECKLGGKRCVCKVFSRIGPIRHSGSRLRKKGGFHCTKARRIFISNSRMNFGEQWNKELEEKSPQEIIQWAASKFGNLYQSTAFGPSGMVIMSMINQRNQPKRKEVNLLFIDTLYHFQETLELKEKSSSLYNATVYTIKPKGFNNREEFEKVHGSELWLKNPDLYGRCVHPTLFVDYLVKAEPGHRAYSELNVDAVFTGRRRTQGLERQDLPIIEFDLSITPPLVKINPLANWDYVQVWNYIRENNVPYNALHDQGYRSIGDFHSTVPTKKGESEREGRWNGQNKSECGLHKDYFKLKKAALQASIAETTFSSRLDIYSFSKFLQKNADARENYCQNFEQNHKLGVSITIGLKTEASTLIQELQNSEKNVTATSLPTLSTYAATVFASFALSIGQICSLIDAIPSIQSIRSLDHTSDGNVSVIEMLFIADGKDIDPLSKKLLSFSMESKVDVVIRKDNVFRKQMRLVIFDMDSTLIQQEVIDELAREAGVYEKISVITEAAMRGEIDFNESLRKRVGLLTGSPTSIIENVKNRIVFTPGALELCRALKKLGYKIAVLSGGFMPLANFVKSTLGLDYAFANTLEMTPDGSILTGKVSGEIVNGERKAELLKEIAELEKISTNQIIAVGDGANDLLMLAEADLGVAFNAKPKVQQQAKARINQPSLMHLLHILGYSGGEIQTLVSV